MAEQRAGAGSIAGPLTNRILNQRYELQERVGGGAMAVVYRARDVALGGRIVAVKILREQYGTDEKFLARFNREASAAAGLNHPNIVSVYDVGADGDISYIVMEYVAGETLRSYMDRQKVVPPDTAAAIAEQICAALAAAHAIGIIHRDIKPHNVLISEQGTVKVTDFGIAKGLSEISMTETGVALGTVQYFSPEQARGLRVVPQSDLYSVGVILFEMLTGRLPFESDSMMGIALKHIQDPAPHPRSLNPNIPAGLDAIVMKSLEKQPEARFASAEAMAGVLRDYRTFTYQPAATVAPSPTVKQDPYGQTTYVAPPRVVAPRTPTSQRPQYVPPTPVNNYPTTRRPTGYIEVEKSSGPGIGSWLIGLLVLVLLAGGVIFATTVLPTLGNQSSPTPTTVPIAAETPAVPSPTNPPVGIIPSVIGKTREEARNILGNAGYHNIAEQTATSRDIPYGSIIAQQPDRGEQAPVDTTITLTVSIGRKPLNVTDYTNFDAQDVKKQLENFGIVVQLTEQPSPVQKGAVIGQQPAAGTTIYEGDTLTLIVSSGGGGGTNPTPPPSGNVTVPAVAQISSEEANAAIANASLVPIIQPAARGEFGIDLVLYDNTPNGVVLATNPPAGTTVPSGSQVTIYVKQDKPGGNLSDNRSGQGNANGNQGKDKKNKPLPSSPTLRSKSASGVRLRSEPFARATRSRDRRHRPAPSPQRAAHRQHQPPRLAAHCAAPRAGSLSSSSAGCRD